MFGDPIFNKNKFPIKVLEEFYSSKKTEQNVVLLVAHLKRKNIPKQVFLYGIWITYLKRRINS